MNKYHISRDDFYCQIDGEDYTVALDYTFNRQEYGGDHFNEPTSEDSNHEVDLREVTKWDDRGDEVNFVLTDDLRKKIVEKIIDDLTEEAEEV